MIVKHKFESVRLCYENHYREIVESYLSSGWSIQRYTPPDYPKGQINAYITFEAGEDAKEVNIDYPNASKL